MLTETQREFVRDDYDSESDEAERRVKARTIERITQNIRDLSLALRRRLDLVGGDRRRSQLDRDSGDDGTRSSTTESET